MRGPHLSISILAVFFLILILAIPSFGKNKSYEKFSTAVDSILVAGIESDAPGAGAAVIENGNVVYRRCMGLASLEHRVPITNATVFNLASVTKQFTALAVLLLEQEGKLSLDDDIHKHFPELPDYGASVTLRHLLHHTSGLWEFSKMLRYYGGHAATDYTSIDDVLTLLKGQDQLLFEPGSQWTYCNSNYALLGELVSRVTGESIAAWAGKHIFEPLEMHNTAFQEDCFRVIPHMADCYYKTGDYYKRDPRNSDVPGQSYLYSTIDDMVLWLDNFRHHKVGGDSLIERMFQASALNNGSRNFYGYGLGVNERDGKMIISHAGQTGSFKAMVLYVPDAELGIVVLSNNKRIGTEELAYEILDLFLNPEVQETVEKSDEAEHKRRPFISMDSFGTGNFGGAYRVEGGERRLLIYQTNSGLYGIFDGRGSDFFRPFSETEFGNGSGNVSIIFYPGDGNHPENMLLNIKGDTMWAVRQEYPSPSPEQLAADYSGTYYFSPLDVAYNVLLDADRLLIRHPRYSDRPLQVTGPDEFVGTIGIVRFTRNERNEVDGFRLCDEDTNFKPLMFKRM